MLPQLNQLKKQKARIAKSFLEHEKYLHIGEGETVAPEG